MLSKIKNIWHQKNAYIALLSKWGLKYKCPICGFHAKDLLPIGIENNTIHKYQIIGAGKRNAGCPRCGSTDRERLLYTYLKYEIRVFNNPSIKILHIAPEIILMRKFIEGGFTNYTCGDFFAEGQHANYSRDIVKHIDVQNMPFAEGSFDLIMCNHVLEHVFDEKKAMHELFRVLTSGGQAILQVPISPILDKTISDTAITDGATLEEKFGQKDHVRLFGKDYKSRLESCGFNVQEIKLERKYPKYALNPKELLFVGKK